MTGVVHPDWEDAGADWPNRECSQFATAGEIRWHYQRMGSGPVLLLLHGAGSSTHSWRDLMPLLRERHDVIAPDLPGHGFTRIARSQQVSLSGMSVAVRALLDHLDVVPDLIVGHSAGAAVALEAVHTGCPAPRTVIGLNAALSGFRGLAGVLFPPMARLLALSPGVPWLFSSMTGNPSSTRRLIEGTGSALDDRGIELYARLLGRSEHVGNALTMMALWDLDPLLRALPGIDVPIHLVVGEGDRTVPGDDAAALARSIANITLHEVPRLGHLMHEEAPGEIAKLILEISAA